MDDELQLIRNDLLTLTKQMLDEALDEDNGQKLPIGEVLGVLAFAIEKDDLRSLARAVSWWGRETLTETSGGTSIS